ncbi:MAG: hypothetical protein Q8R92_04220 [Deltaproteobacteria bacterium]|nr:hypothetical protein [Deltaproteobacteria bacterium]
MTDMTWDWSAILPEKWGRDHHSTLLYIESRVTEHKGVPRAANMRTKQGSVRRGHCVLGEQMQHCGDKDYPTRLAGGVLLHGHDDWDCVSDMVAAGLVEWGGTGLHPIFALTDAGWAEAGRLRRAKAGADRGAP